MADEPGFLVLGPIHEPEETGEIDHDVMLDSYHHYVAQVMAKVDSLPPEFRAVIHDFGICDGDLETLLVTHRLMLVSHLRAQLEQQFGKPLQRDPTRRPRLLTRRHRRHGP